MNRGNAAVSTWPDVGNGDDQADDESERTVNTPVDIPGGRICIQSFFHLLPDTGVPTNGN